VHGSSTSSSEFSYTIHENVKKVDKRLEECGGCARFGMDDGYMVGPKEVVFEVLAEFAKALEEEHGCMLNTMKCKMYSINEGVCQQAKEEEWIPTELEYLEEGTMVDETRINMRGIQIFDVPVREEMYVAAVLREKARKVEKSTRRYVEDLEEEYPQELRTMLQFSLQHRVTYWLRTCTPEETEEMATHVDCCIMEVVQTATGVDFDTEETTRNKLRLPSRMKGGGIKRAMDTRYPAFLGALLDILPRCIDKRDDHRELHPGYYSQQLTETIGRGAYDSGGHKNARFLESREVGPYPEACGKA
jgi:hypothetical protein